MPISNDLLEILCCPKTKVPIQLLTDDQIKQVNRAIQGGKITYVDGSIVDTPLTEGLVTTDLQTIYRIDDSIPVMLIDKGIKADQISELSQQLREFRTVISE